MNYKRGSYREAKYIQHKKLAREADRVSHEEIVEKKNARGGENMGKVKRHLPKKYTMNIEPCGEYPGYGKLFTEKELEDGKCKVRSTDKLDEFGFPAGKECGGDLLEDLQERLTCMNCGQVYNISS